MDTSIRLYNTNSSMRSFHDDERVGHSTVPQPKGEDGDVEADTREETHTLVGPAPSTPASQEQIQRVEVADFESIFLRYQVPITNFIYHLIGNREQANDLAQDV